VLCWHNFRIKDVAALQLQLNTHAIGDSANTVILKIYKETLAGTKTEDGKLTCPSVAKVDFDYFKFRIIPCTATHATSDMYWAEDRLEKGLKNTMHIKNCYKSGDYCIGN
jgi:predicted amidohydrolase YtcJ